MLPSIRQREFYNLSLFALATRKLKVMDLSLTVHWSFTENSLNFHWKTVVENQNFAPRCHREHHNTSKFWEVVHSLWANIIRTQEPQGPFVCKQASHIPVHISAVSKKDMSILSSVERPCLGFNVSSFRFTVLLIWVSDACLEFFSISRF